MKKLVGGIALGALLTAPALAADLPARVPVKAPAPVVAAAYSWTGCYIGAHVGAARGETDVTDVDAYSAGAIPGTVTSADKTGIFGGGQIGCNWQMSQWVFGIEGQGGYMDIGETVPLTATASGTRVGLRSGAYGDITGRLGIAFNQVLAYGKGGVAFYGTIPHFSTVTGSFSRSEIDNFNVGWTVGGGLEFRVAPNWSVKGEYQFYRFSNADFTVFNAGGTPFRFNQDLDIHTVKFGVNYYFGGPVVARY